MSISIAPPDSILGLRSRLDSTDYFLVIVPPTVITNPVQNRREGAWRKVIKDLVLNDETISDPGRIR